MLKQCKNRAGESLLSVVESVEITQAQKFTLIYAVKNAKGINPAAAAELLKTLGVELEEVVA